MKLRELSSGRQFEIEAERNGSAIQARVGGDSITLPTTPQPDGSILIELGGRRARAFAVRRGDLIHVSIGPAAFTFAAVQTSRGAGRHSLATPMLTAPMPGKVLKVLVSEGEEVEAGRALLTMEAMKMETTLAAEGAARVKRIAVSEGQMVDAGAVLMELSPIDSAAPQSAR